MPNSNRPLLLGGMILTAVLVAANLIVANLVIRSVDARWDLTEDKRFEIGRGTTNILSNLDGQVNVRVFLTDAMPQRLAHIQRTIVEKLQEYERAAEGKLVYSFVDPGADTIEGKRAKSDCDDMGIQPARVQEFEDVATSREVECYMAMVFQYGDRKSPLHLVELGVDSLQTQTKFAADLEYFITTAIQRVSKPRKTIGIMGDIQMVPMNPQDPRSEQRKSLGITHLQQSLERNYDVLLIDSKEVRAEGAISPDVETLVVYRPTGLSPIALYKLDQFIMHGGNVLFMVDQGSADSAPKQKQGMMGNQPFQDLDLPTYAGVPLITGIGDFLEHLGVRVEPMFIMDKSAFGFYYIKDKQLRQNPLFRTIYAEPIQDRKEYPCFPVIPARGRDGEVLDPDQLNRNRSMVARLNGVVLAWASPLTILPEAVAKHNDRENDVEVPAVAEVLMKSGPSSWTLPIEGNVFPPARLIDEAPPALSPSPLMVMLNGRFRSFFRGQDIPTMEGPDGSPAVPPDDVVNSRLNEASSRSSIIVLGDADFIQDNVINAVLQWEYQESRNVERARSKPRAMLALVVQAVDVLAFGGEASDLIDIRDKRMRSREIVKLDANDDRRRWNDVLNFVAVPGLIVLLGLIRFLVRFSATGDAAQRGENFRIEVMIRNVVLALILVAQIGIWFFVDSPFSKEPPKSEPLKSKKLAGVEIDSVESIEFTDVARKVLTIERRDGVWVVETLHGYPATQDRVAKALDMFRDLASSDFRSDKRSMHENYEVDDARGQKIVFRGADRGVLGEYMIGKRDIQGAQGTFIREAMSDDVYVARSQDMATSLSAEPYSWLSRQMLDVELMDQGRMLDLKNACFRIEIEGRQPVRDPTTRQPVNPPEFTRVRYVYERVDPATPGGDFTWKVVEPEGMEETVLGDLQVKTVVQNMLAIQLVSIVSPAALPEHGLDDRENLECRVLANFRDDGAVHTRLIEIGAEFTPAGAPSPQGQMKQRAARVGFPGDPRTQRFVFGIPHHYPAIFLREPTSLLAPAMPKPPAPPPATEEPKKDEDG